LTRSVRLGAVLAVAVSACGAADSALEGSGADGASNTPGVDPPMKGTLYEPGRHFGQTYCSPCHWKGGQDPQQPRAVVAFRVDTYEDWATSPTILLAILDKWNPDGNVMPPPDAIEPPDDQRRLILAWVRRGLPNTIDGNE